MTDWVEDPDEFDEYGDEQNKIFVVMWDHYGLDGIVDITLSEKQHVIDVLEGRETKIPDLKPMFLRARYNPSRNYEIYGVKAGSVPAEMIAKLFEVDPQAAANMIREKGVKLHGGDVKAPVIK